jgi:hypothetical protein
MSSILVDDQDITRNYKGWKDECYTVIGRKGRCGHVWCPSCGKKAVNRFYRYLKPFRWDHVRHCVLTIDRRKFDNDARGCYKYISEGKHLSEFVRRLKSGGVQIIKHRWILEWHRDGFPHWHFLFEVEKTGRYGQIGNKDLLEAWRFGAVREWYFQTEYHWKRFIGYFHKTGYFEQKKAHQAKLPGWALESKVRIRRHGGSESIKTKNGIDRLPEKPENEWIETGRGDDYITRRMWRKRQEKSVPDEDDRTNLAILESCGCQTDVCVLVRTGKTFELEGKDGKKTVIEDEPKVMHVGLMPIKYRDFKSRSGDYVPKYGYRIGMSLKEWCDFYYSYVF